MDKLANQINKPYKNSAVERVELCKQIARKQESKRFKKRRNDEMS